jgi:hypothetical protein
MMEIDDIPHNGVSGYGSHRLPLSVASAASLFVTCIQCFDIVVKGKSFSEDYEQLHTLVCALNFSIVDI